MMTHKSDLNDIIRWDVATWSKAIAFWEQQVDWDNVNDCLELGGNEGGLSLWLALKDKTVRCTDLHDPEKNARPLHERYGVTGLVTYQEMDATAIPFENRFDVIVFKSIIGGIGRNDRKDVQQVVFDQIQRALKPGGVLLFAENLCASRFHRWVRRKFVNWGGSWRYITTAELPDFLKRFSSFQYRTTGVAAAFGRTERQRRILSFLDRWLLDRLCPASWRYVVYGVAVK